MSGKGVAYVVSVKIVLWAVGRDKKINKIYVIDGCRSTTTVHFSEERLREG